MIHWIGFAAVWLFVIYIVVRIYDKLRPLPPERIRASAEHISNNYLRKEFGPTGHRDEKLTPDDIRWMIRRYGYGALMLLELDEQNRRAKEPPPPEKEVLYQRYSEPPPPPGRIWR